MIANDRHRRAATRRAGEYRNKECLIYDPGTYYKEWSSVLNREMEFKVYGSAGVPVLALPARAAAAFMIGRTTACPMPLPRRC